jgi:large subunit ribosomal protein L25
MISLTAKIRKQTGRRTNTLRNAGRIPAIVYGHKKDNALLDIDLKEFEEVYKKTGESSLIELSIDGEKQKRLVLVHEMQKDPVSDNITHIDFFQAALDEETEVSVPLVFEGESLAVKDLGGTLVKNISEVEVKALPQNLPHEIKVSIEPLKTFEDHILIRDLVLPKDVKITAKSEEIVASVLEPSNIEEDLAKEIKENVEDVQKVEKEKKEDEPIEQE